MTHTPPTAADAAPPRFHVGQFVQVTNETSSTPFLTGTIVQVDQVEWHDSTGARYLVHHPEHGQHWIDDEGDLEGVDFEPAEALVRVGAPVLDPLRVAALREARELLGSTMFARPTVDELTSLADWLLEREADK